MASIAPTTTWNTVSDQVLGEPTLMRAFTGLQWAVINLARKDPPSSLRSPGRFLKFAQLWLGLRGYPRLADPKLEALRRIAVLVWSDGYLIEGDEVGRFIKAGFSLEQYEALQRWIRSFRLQQREARP